MRAKKIFEKFEEDSDPIKDMGIGNIIKLFPKLATFLEEELAWNDASVIIDNDTLIYTCLPGGSVIPDIKEAIEKFGLGGKLKVNKGDPCSRTYDDGCSEHTYIISIKKSKR